MTGLEKLGEDILYNRITVMLRKFQLVCRPVIG